MSRTWNTAPYEVQKRRYISKGEHWRFYHYLSIFGGCQEDGRAEWAHRFEKQFRQQVRADLHHGREPPQRVARRVKRFIW